MLELRMPDGALTPRELEVLLLAADGLTDDQIGQQIHCSSATVGAHMCKVLKKLGARNRTHAVAIGIRAGMIRWEV